MRKFLRGLFVLSLLGLFWGCYPDAQEYYSDYDIVYTNYDNTNTFTGKKNYIITDKIAKFTGNLAEGEQPEYLKEPYASQILTQIKQNMTNMGYTLVSSSSTADVALIPTAIEITTVGYYYDYWYGYWGWYGWYYPYPITYSYTTGSLVMNLLDAKAESPDGKKRIVWTGIVNGLLEGSTTDFMNRMTKSIDQSFTQSPYLKQ